jgi:hypothetical protein
MITKTHTKGDAPSTAIYSDCENYRYSLTRIWDDTAPRVLFVMLNPSTATEVQNDPTVERCERRARTLGYGSFCVCNIFAYRATDPKKMRAQTDPVGPENDKAISDAAAWANDIVCAWGTHGAHMDRGPSVERMLRSQPKPLTHLGLSIAGHPKHPLYIGYKVQPQSWDE